MQFVAVARSCLKLFETVCDSLDSFEVKKLEVLADSIAKRKFVELNTSIEISKTINQV